MKKAIVILLGVFLASNLSASEPVNGENWQQHPAIKKIRALYVEVNNSQKTGKLKKETMKCELYNGNVVMEGVLYIDRNSIVRKYVIDTGSGDSRARAEYYYDENGVPRFTFRFRGAYNGTEVEERIYFDETGKHLYTNRKAKGPGYTASGLTDSVEYPSSDYKTLCKE